MYLTITPPGGRVVIMQLLSTIFPLLINFTTLFDSYSMFLYLCWQTTGVIVRANKRAQVNILIGRVLGFT